MKPYEAYDVGPMLGNLRGRFSTFGATYGHFQGIWGDVEVISGLCCLWMKGEQARCLFWMVLWDKDGEPVLIQGCGPCWAYIGQLARQGATRSGYVEILFMADGILTHVGLISEPYCPWLHCRRHLPLGVRSAVNTGTVIYARRLLELLSSRLCVDSNPL